MGHIQSCIWFCNDERRFNERCVDHYMERGILRQLYSYYHIALDENFLSYPGKGMNNLLLQTRTICGRCIIDTYNSYDNGGFILCIRYQAHGKHILCDTCIPNIINLFNKHAIHIRLEILDINRFVRTCYIIGGNRWSMICNIVMDVTKYIHIPGLIQQYIINECKYNFSLVEQNTLFEKLSKEELKLDLLIRLGCKNSFDLQTIIYYYQVVYVGKL